MANHLRERDAKPLADVPHGRDRVAGLPGARRTSRGLCCSTTTTWRYADVVSVTLCGKVCLFLLLEQIVYDFDSRPLPNLFPLI